MATLVLSTVGTALGGPLGGAIGSLIGQSIDQQLFGPGPRQGPRLGDLSVQTSSYGTPIPRLYGTMRVAGSVIWATELKESSEPQNGAKGQPETIVYSYSASFAVALSCRRIKSVRRIWADGKLLRGAAGDFKVKTQFRLHLGGEDQGVDPLIASVEGLSETPAYRGVATAVFEDLELAEFGNRIPFLTFEVEADAGAVPLDTLLGDASGGVIDSAPAPAIDGYAAYGRSIRSAIEPLVVHFGVELFDDGTALRSPSSAIVTPAHEELGCSADSDRHPLIERRQASAGEAPSSLTFGYYEPERDYQRGEMRASNGGGGGLHESVELPATLSAAASKALAQNSLVRRWAQRERVTIRLAPPHISMEPGSRVRLPHAAAPWTAERVTIDGLAIIAELRPAVAAAFGLPATPGRLVPAPDVVATATSLALLDLPDLGLGRHDLPVLHLSACSASEGWKPVPVEIRAGSELRTSQSAYSETVAGKTLAPLGSGQAALFDQVNVIEVELTDGDHWLESCDDDALIGGTNLAAVGSELVQFGSVTPIGPASFRLERLLRGRRGTEWAMHGHQAGEPFVLLKANSLRPIELPREMVGATVEVRALGVGDGTGTSIAGIAGGESMRPPSPVHLRTSVADDGGLEVSWVRRSRGGWRWVDEMEAPLGESDERYRVRLSGSAETIELQTATANAAFTAQEVAAIGGGEITVTVAQVGDHALSRPAAVVVTVN